MASYTYRFVDNKGEIIYIGKTVDINRRMGEHFGGKGHLAKECYSSTARIDYQKHKTESDSLIAETYLITKYNPKYNKLQKSRDIPTMELDENWKVYKEIKQVKPLRVQNTGWWRFVAVGYIILVILYYLLK